MTAAACDPPRPQSTHRHLICALLDCYCRGNKMLVCHRGPGSVLGDVCLDGRRPRPSTTAVIARGRVVALLIPHSLTWKRSAANPVVRAALNRSANAQLVQEAMERFVECESEVSSTSGVPVPPACVPLSRSVRPAFTQACVLRINSKTCRLASSLALPAHKLLQVHFAPRVGDHAAAGVQDYPVTFPLSSCLSPAPFCPCCRCTLHAESGTTQPQGCATCSPTPFRRRPAAAPATRCCTMSPMPRRSHDN